MKSRIVNISIISFQFCYLILAIAMWVWENGTYIYDEEIHFKFASVMFVLFFGLIVVFVLPFFLKINKWIFLFNILILINHIMLFLFRTKIRL